MTLGLVVADTVSDKRLARLAVERTLSELPVDDCLVISDEPLVAGARQVAIEPLDGLGGYNRMMLDRLHEWVRCDAYVVVQWDGFAIDGRRWRRGLLEWDYIGAPWVHMNGTVGSGGFSLRSRRLIEAVAALRRTPRERDVGTPEDVQICVTYRSALEALGMRFAPAAVARTFSFERIPLRPAAPAIERPPTIGFHGPFNFPVVLREDEVLATFPSLMARLGTGFAAWYLLIVQSYLRGYETLLGRTLEVLAERDPRLWARVIQACVQHGMPLATIKAVT